MKRFLSFIVSLFVGASSLMAIPAYHLDSIYSVLDREIARSEIYFAQRRERIKRLRGQYARTKKQWQLLEISRGLYEEYAPYHNDSAIYYLQNCIALARLTKKPSRVAEYQSMTAYICSKTGMYDEAKEILTQIDTNGIDEKAKGEYYRAYYTLYSELAYYTTLPAMKSRYRQKALEYEKPMVATLPPNDDACFMSRESHLMNVGNYRASLAENTCWLKSVKKDSHRYALVTLFRYLEYKAVNDTTNMMYWGAQSALADVRNGVMDLGSMWELANQLMLQGDVARSYHYISYMTECSNFFGSRQRNWQITPLLSVIANNYKNARIRHTRQLALVLGLTCVLAICLLVMLFYSNRQRRHLSETRNDLRDSNKQLLLFNEQIEKVNIRLTEANRVKEEYIGRFLGLCTFYVDKMDEFRKQVARLLRKHDFDELAALTRTNDYKQQQIDELYASFDNALLHLFPTFVDDFNALLKPGHKVELPYHGRLNTTIRIFALIRLGIDDSSKIAEFLNYSVNTIYNYRVKVKNGSLGDRDKFEEQVRKIGMNG